MISDSFIFETERLYTRNLNKVDNETFYDLKSNPKVMNPLPRKVLNRLDSNKELERLIELEKSTSKTIWAICVKHNNELIGCCGFMKNNENNDEIGYQLRERFWGKGYGTEIAKGLIEYGFNVLNSSLITADVNSINKGSIKILNKFMKFEKEFYNENDNCIDQRFTITKSLFK